MNLTAALNYLADRPDMGCNENIAFRCQAAKRLEEAGDYEGSREVLGERWLGPGKRPDLSGLDARASAELLLRVGLLSHRIAVTETKCGAQGDAKDLLSEAERLFRTLGDLEGEAAATVGLALCCWRKTELDEARIILTQLLERLVDSACEQRASAMVALAHVEWSAKNDDLALEIFRDCAPLIEAYAGHRLKAGYHSGLALVWRRLGEIDNALVEAAAASYHLEQAGDVRQCATLVNNTGNLLADAGRFDEAHQHFERARSLYDGLSDRVSAARVDESCAQVCLIVDRPSVAVDYARRAAGVLEGSEERSAYVKALVTLGCALARSGNGAAAWETFERAREVALNYLGEEATGKISVTMRDELAPMLFGDPGMTYFSAYREFQRAMIKKALRETDWIVVKAAFKLGMKQQGLDQLLKGTHKEVMEAKPQLL